jgi:hypothetical protein
VEQISFEPDGRVVLTIGDDKYTLSRPKFKHVRRFRERITDLSNEAIDKITDLTKQMAALESDSEEWHALEERFKEMRLFTFEYTVLPWLREVFKELGDKPLPKNLGEVPAFLANQGLPMQIWNHWLNVPLGSGGDAKS